MSVARAVSLLAVLCAIVLAAAPPHHETPEERRYAEALAEVEARAAAFDFPPAYNINATTLAEYQLDALRWFFVNFDGLSWTPHVRDEWVLTLANETVDRYIANCSGAEVFVLVPGVLCQEGAIFQVHVGGFGLRGPMAELNYTSFIQYFTFTDFDFSSNHLYGPFADDIPVNCTLQGYRVARNRLTGPVPGGIFTWTVMSIDISQNPLNATNLTEAVANAHQLQSLNLAMLGEAGGEVPAVLCNLTRLQGLQLTLNNYSSLPPCFGEKLGPSLLQLNLDSNKFAGPVPEDLCRLKHLTQLILSVNPFTGALPDCFCNFTAMADLEFQATQMSMPFPSFVFGCMFNLKILMTSGLYGPVNDYFGQLSLDKLILAGPAQEATSPSETLNGPFPMSIFSNSGLVLLMVQNTFFEGTIFSANFSTLPLLSQVAFIQNQVLRGEYPAYLLEYTFTTNFTSDLQFPRQINIDFNPYFTGALPDLTEEQAKAIIHLETASPDAFMARHNDFYGWVPDSLLLWLPKASQRNFLVGNPKLWYPVQPAALPITGYFHGDPGTVSSFVGKHITFSMAGGENVTLTGRFPVADEYLVAFFPGNISSYELFLQANKSGAAAALAQSVAFAKNASLPWATRQRLAREAASGPRDAGSAYATELELLMPEVDESTDYLQAMLFLRPPGRIGEFNDTLALAAKNSAPAFFYNPQPTVQSISRSVVRPQGCVPLTIHGSGFRNAPEVVVQIQARPSLMHGGEARNVTIPVSASNVIHDSEIRFLLPFADEKDPSATYDNFTQGRGDIPFPVVVFPAGLALSATEHSRRSSAAMLRFEATCDGPLTRCANGHTDPYQCPTPMCLCSSLGACVAQNSSAASSRSSSFAEAEEFTCACDANYNGTLCDLCDEGRFGETCEACDCEHGACDWGREASGKCTCESGWFGERCSISKLAVGLGVGLSVGALAIGGGVFALVRWRRRSGAYLDSGADERLTQSAVHH